MTYVVIGLTIVFLFVLIMIKGAADERKYNAGLINKAEKDFTLLSERKYSSEELESIKRFYENFKDKNSIDDITASDLDLDEIYKRINKSLSAAGDEFLYFRLRTPDTGTEQAEFLEKAVDEIGNKAEVRAQFQKNFLKIGRLHKICFKDFLDLIETVEDRTPVREYVCLILLIVSFASMFVYPSVGIAFFILMLSLNIIDYYRQRGVIEPYIIGFAYAVNLVDTLNKLKGFEGTVFEEKSRNIKEHAGSLRKLYTMYKFVGGQSRSAGAGNPVDLLMDYLRMIFHIDIILFYRALRFLKSHISELTEIYFETGELEYYYNCASFRKSFPKVCVPVIDDSLNIITGKEIYHPLIKDCVTNSFTNDKGMLITGSNASGKSTFLRTVAINLIFAETLHTCLAEEFKLPPVLVYSSMSIRDDIVHGDSYFMAEIKALKRIFDKKKEDKDARFAVFTDELLRGTNTVERIASVSRVLTSLNDGRTFVFAATHDTELTDILSDIYENYYFDGEILDDDVRFNYRLNKGHEASKNAIRLLSLLGFDDEIVKDASSMADNFLKTGNWSI